MLRNNVMSFMKKMGMTQQEGSTTQEESGRTFSRFLGNLGNMGKPTNPPNPVDPVDAQPSTSGTTSTTESPKPKPEEGALKNIITENNCRICRKKFGPKEDSLICCQCKHKICEDCASYSSTHDPTWRCTVCRLKVASREQQIKAQESTDSLLDIPIETLHRRHSDARLGASNQIVPSESGLAPPRQEIRRHSDVSPASLKELEKFRKVAGEHQKSGAELDRNKSSEPRFAESPNRNQTSETRGKSASPQRAIVKPAQTGVEQKGTALDDEDEYRRSARGGAIRRSPHMTRQKSYDDEISTAMVAGGAQSTHSNTGILGLSTQLPRRASAYDVYAAPGNSGFNGMATQQRTTFSAQVKAREPEDRSTTRRSSFRVVNVMMLYDDDITENELNTSSASAMALPASQNVFMPDEERRNRRRGSQLPDVNAMRHNASLGQPGAAKATVPAAAVGRFAAEEREFHRQGSLVDGEAIKIIIHDVDSNYDPMIDDNRRVQLRRDPLLDRGYNKSCGFGLKVIGGKPDSVDGHIYAYIAWTVPGGPAERAGLQQGDKVLAWCGTTLVNRSPDEVQQIINQSMDLVELVVEQTPDTFGNMDDLQGKTFNMGLLKEKQMEKAPSSPTRRRLPKTPV